MTHFRLIVCAVIGIVVHCITLVEVGRRAKPGSPWPVPCGFLAAILAEVLTWELLSNC